MSFGLVLVVHDFEACSSGKLHKVKQAQRWNDQAAAEKDEMDVKDEVGQSDDLLAKNQGPWRGSRAFIAKWSNSI